MEKRLLFVIVILAIIVVPLGCSRSAKDDAIKLGLIPVEDNFPFFIAEKENLFSRAGLNVELVVFNSARDRDIALQSKNIDGEVADIIATVLMFNSGTPVKIVSLTMGSTPEEGRFALLTAPGSGIKGPSQLSGASIGISENTIIEYVTDGLLKEAGLSPDSVKKIAIPQIPERLQLLLSDKIDAALLPDPFASLAEQKGALAVLDDTKSEKNLSQVVLVFREEVIGQKAEMIAKLLQVYSEAAKLASENPEAYRDLFIEKARIPEDLRDIYLAPRYSYPQLPQEKDVEEVVSWMLAKGLISEPLEYCDIVETSFIRHAGGNP